jgi:hypothetical protein
MNRMQTFDEYCDSQEFADSIGYMIIEIPEAMLRMAFGGELHEGQ